MVWGSVMNRLFFGVVTVLALTGCSIYEASRTPPPVDYRNVHVGETRAETVSILGYPKMTQAEGSRNVDYFEFTDGYHPASKARIILYVAGDVFTLGLAEVIFWPTELALLQGTECRGTVTYRPDNRVVGYSITHRDGTPLWVSEPPQAPAAPAPVPNASTEEAPAAEPAPSPATPEA